MLVCIHEAVVKADGVAFRCTLSGAEADRWLEVPAWMFDRVACPDPPRLTASPFVSSSALVALGDLLDLALKRLASSSNAPHLGASKSSRKQNRREAHEDADAGAFASRGQSTAKAAARQRSTTDRSVRRRIGNGHAGMAGSTGCSTQSTDGLDGAADPGARADGQFGVSDGGRS
jgi:hypothetical protein